MKKKIFEKLKELASSLNGLISLSIVGSHGDEQKPLEKTNDFDLLFIFEKLDAATLSMVKDRLNELTHDLDKPDHAVFAEFRIGSIKATCPRGAPYCSMLHALIYDKESFIAYKKLAPFATLDWSRFEPLWGTALKDLFDFRWPTKEDLINAPRHSITFYRKMINDKVYIVINLVEKEGVLSPEKSIFPIPIEQLPEVISNTLNAVILDTIIVYKKEDKGWSNRELLDIFFDTFPQFKEEKADLEFISSLKKKIRSNEVGIGALNVADLEFKLKSFLNKLELLVKG